MPKKGRKAHGTVNHRAFCEPCEKRCYSDRKNAATVAAKVRREHGELVQAYKCKHGHWHLGHPPTAEGWRNLEARMGVSPDAVT